MTATDAHADPLSRIPEALRDPRDGFGSASLGKIGMWIFLVTDCMTFSGLLLAYGILRAGTPHWPAASSWLGIPLTAWNTFVLIVSSVMMVLAFSACQEGNRKRTALFLGLTMLGGLMFLGGQAVEYTDLIRHGFVLYGNKIPGMTPAAQSTFFVVTSFHGCHVFTGVVYLGVMLVNTLRGKYDGGNSNSIEIAGLFWHFVDLIWILVFTFVYLIPVAS